MPLVMTLIAAPDFKDFSGFVTTLQQRLASMQNPVWLHPEHAVDVALDESERQTAETLLHGHALDYAFQAPDSRRKKILIADMDSTMIGQECIDELAAEVGLKDRVAAITAAAMRGEIEFEPALRERVALLKGLPEMVVDEVIKNRITLTPGGTTLVATMKRHGAYTALVSGGFTAFTQRISGRIGFNENRANTLHVKDGMLTGTVQEPILGKQAKVDALQEIAARLDLAPQDAIAVGDGANDLGMIQLAGSGVAIHAKPAVAAEADMRIEHNDLSALLYLQGYPRSEWDTAND